MDGWDCPKWSKCVSPLMDPLLQLGGGGVERMFLLLVNILRDVRVQEIDADEDRPRRRPEYIPVAQVNNRVID